MHRLLLLPLLSVFVVACADDKDPIQCPSDPACTSAGTQPNSSDDSNSNGENSQGDTSNGTMPNPTSATDVIGTTSDDTTQPVTTSEPLPTSDSLATTDVDPSDPSTPDTTTVNETIETTADPDTTTGVSMFGQCGWYDEEKYYDCAPPAEPGLEDPEGISPIECPGGLAEGDPCTDDDGPVNSVGCCTPEGVLFFCDTQDTMAVYRVDCV